MGLPGISNVRIVYFVILSHLCITRATNEYEDATVPKDDNDKAKVKVRSVFVNCLADSINTTPDSEETRFEQQELFKHGALKDCVKKMAVTIKITSESDTSGDEYLPIEHVFEGSEQKRVRLLDPYVLRLRRDIPLQAYKLRNVEIVRGILLDPPYLKRSKVRVRRESGTTIEDGVNGKSSHQLQHEPSTLTPISNGLKGSEKNIMCRSQNKISERYKRKDRNIVVEGDIDTKTKWTSKDHSYRNKKKINSDFDNLEHVLKLESSDIKEGLENDNVVLKNSPRKHKPVVRILTPMVVSPEEGLTEKSYFEQQHYIRDPSGHNISGEGKISDYNRNENLNYEDTYAIYEIGPPLVWYTVHVQLFEKLSTPDDQTLWNDLTKGDVASVSSVTPEWAGSDVNVRYRSTRWIPREEFTLPTNPLCLLVSQPDEEVAYSNINNITSDDVDNGKFMIVPEEDIIDMKEEGLKKRAESDMDNSEKNSEEMEQKCRKVAIRLTRSVLRDNGNIPNILTIGEEKYLTLKHEQPYTVQIDLEVRADENELVHVGTSGRISIAVADSTRRTRTILNLQIGNTGLAAANFRVAARDFDPILSELVKVKEAIVAGPILIPPRHTRSIHLELPFELLAEVAHCSVILLNDQEKSVAIRDVLIKKGDRCFCVWHCQCVCLSDDPRLICRDMDDASVKAAGLTTDHPRRTRAVCCANVVTLNFLSTFSGVVTLLLLLGLIKAFLGLLFRRIAIAGLPQLLQTPRKLEKYYEASLKNKTVVYDEDNWPVHPDTKARTVRLVSIPMEFMLNTIYFVCAPCLLLYEGVKTLISYLRGEEQSSVNKSQSSVLPQQNKDVGYSTHDMQTLMSRRRRVRDELRRWMSPQAQELSTELWRKSRVVPSVHYDSMQPLLLGSRSRDASLVTHEASCDSEQDDTEYVLTQMQKSRESLAKVEGVRSNTGEPSIKRPVTIVISAKTKHKGVKKSEIIMTRQLSRDQATKCCCSNK